MNEGSRTIENSIFFAWLLSFLKKIIRFLISEIEKICVIFESIHCSCDSWLSLNEGLSTYFKIKFSCHDYFPQYDGDRFVCIAIDFDVDSKLKGREVFMQWKIWCQKLYSNYVLDWVRHSVVESTKGYKRKLYRL